MTPRTARPRWQEAESLARAPTANSLILIACGNSPQLLSRKQCFRGWEAKPLARSSGAVGTETHSKPQSGPPCERWSAITATYCESTISIFGFLEREGADEIAKILLPGSGPDARTLAIACMRSLGGTSARQDSVALWALSNQLRKRS